jgi:hypothetical protein
VLAIQLDVYEILEHPAVARTLNSLGNTLMHERRLAEARDMLDVALYISRRIYEDSDHPDAINALALITQTDELLRATPTSRGQQAAPLILPKLLSDFLARRVIVVR